MKKTWLCTGILVFLVVVAVAETQEKVTAEETRCSRLARNVKIDFEIFTPGQEGYSSYLITASPNFESRVLFEGNDGEMGFSIVGEVELLEDDSIFIQFEAEMLVHGDNKRGNIELRTGILLDSGKEVSVSQFADKTLMIRAEYQGE